VSVVVVDAPGHMAGMSDSTPTSHTTTWDASDVPRSADGRYKEYVSSRPEGAALTAAFDEDAAVADDEVQPEAAVPGRLARWKEAAVAYKQRCRELLSSGYMPAAATPAVVDPRTREGIDTFWENHYATEEQAAGSGVGTYEVMPDDYTPAGASGRSLDGKRRTHRMGYSNSEVAIRMPSATSVRRYASDVHGRTFDMPVEGSYPGGSVSGYVRVTRGAKGTWSVSGLGMDETANAYVSESVQAVLEARSVRSALPNMPDVLAHRAERLRSVGVAAKPVIHSDFIRSAGYNANDGQLVVNLGGRTYGYRNVPRETFDRLMNPGIADRYSAGKVYNALVKGQHDHFPVTECPSCGRFYESDRPHRCASQHQERAEDQQDRSAAYAQRVRNRLLSRVTRH
jgi:hypothetical protein